MVLPTDTALAGTPTPPLRSQAPDSIALLAPGTAANAGAAAGSPARLGGVLPIAPINAAGPQLALHPPMGALQTMFDTDRRLAIVANVGPLIAAHHQGAVRTARTAAAAACSRTTTSRTPGRRCRPKAPRSAGAGAWATCWPRATARPCSPPISASGNAVWLAGQTCASTRSSSGGADPHGRDSNGRSTARPRSAAR